VLRISIREQLRSLFAPFGLTIVMYAVVLVVSSALSPFEGLVGWAKLAAIVLVGVIVYGASLRLIRRDLYQQLVASVRRVLLPA
jgi:heme O synthase-like polyprenyltransferase